MPEVFKRTLHLPRLLRNKRKYAKWRQKQKRIRQNHTERWLRGRQQRPQQQPQARQRHRLHQQPRWRPPQRRRPPPRPSAAAGVGHPSLEVAVSGANEVLVGSRQDFAPDGDGNYEVRN